MKKVRWRACQRLHLLRGLRAVARNNGISVTACTPDSEVPALGALGLLGLGLGMLDLRRKARR